MSAKALRRDACTECERAVDCALRTHTGPRQTPCPHFVHYSGHRDICSTCDSSPGCPSIGTVDHPVFHCEEFTTSQQAQRSRYLLSAEAERPVPLGLCADCDCRSTCQAARPDGGVWHCVEYR